MHSIKSYYLTQSEYNYLLPALKNKLSNQNNKHYFIGSIEDLTDVLNRLKGLYDNYNEIKPFTIYECAKYGTITYFRNHLKTNNHGQTKRI